MYAVAGKVLEDLEAKKGSLRALAFTSKHKKNGKQIYALVAETLKKYTLIRNILEKLNLHSGHNVNIYSVSIATYDFLFGKKRVNVNESAGRFVRKYRGVIKSSYAALASSTTEELTTSVASKPDTLLKYVRVNTLTALLKEVQLELEGKGFHEVDFDRLLTSPQDQTSFAQDRHIPDLLVLHPSSLPHLASLCKNSKVVIQDKASCLPAHVLAPSHDSHVIDACAAPGNKTTQLAAQLGRYGHLDAFEIDPKRFKTLQAMIKKSNATYVDAHLMDFLKVNPEDYPKVSHILVDPSCSGSGILNRLEHPYNIAQGPDRQRLQRLSGFQLRVLLHALKFPSVEKVVYSTCSLYKEENEDVVSEALSQVDELFTLDHIMPNWTTRGLPTFGKGHCCLRTDPPVDHTNGFFVALFKRKRRSSADRTNLITCSRKKTGHISQRQSRIINRHSFKPLLKSTHRRFIRCSKFRFGPALFVTHSKHSLLGYH